MKIVSAEFVKSAYEVTHWPPGEMAEVSFLGRSNVGKSSLLNSLLQRKALARTSNTPGRTQCINFFLVNDEFYFVDLPGYGFAKVSKSMRADWGKMAEQYLAEREQLRLSIQLIDARHKPTALDIQLHEWLVYNEKPHVVVATKSDKLSHNELQKQLKVIGNTLAGSKIMPYSSETGKGRDQLWTEINEAVKNS
jgi:GTP-binding protein